MIVLYAIGLYLAIGFIFAVAFVAFGAAQLTHSSFTIGARIILLPGATLLWPYVLARWLKSHTP